MPSRKILVVDDERNILEVLRSYLQSDDYSVIYTDNASEALILAEASAPDLVVVDAVMPGLDGLAFCEALRASPRTAGIPVIMISGKAVDEAAALRAFESGADDYILKPFSLPVLAARIKALLRRYSEIPNCARCKLAPKGIQLDPEGRTLKISGKEVKLSRKEFDLLALLLEKNGRVLGLPYIMETVWGQQMALADSLHTVETHISVLRKKLGPKLGARLKNVTGHGYKFE